MAKRGRKPGTKRKGYFYEKEEQAVVDYLNTTDEKVKNDIYNRYLHPAFSKMVESIINRYKLYPPDESFQETFEDTISFLMTKIDKFDVSKGCKSYSYCGTICKNYLIHKIEAINKNKKRIENYDCINDSIADSIKFSYGNSKQNNFLNDLMNSTINEIKNTIETKEENKLSNNDIKVGLALIELMTNWEEMFAQMGSNKFNKSSILLFLKETTLLSPKEIRESMKKYKCVYYAIKKELIEDDEKVFSQIKSTEENGEI